MASTAALSSVPFVEQQLHREGGDEMTITPLGGGCEVGRSCILLQYRGRTLMLDCGSHPGKEGNDSLPFFDTIDDPANIDMILITHFHIDHCAALPYFTEKTNFKGKIFMTHATKAVMKLLLSDNIRLQARSSPLYTEQELQNCVEKIDVFDFSQTIEYKGVKVTASPAGHVLGAAMFLIEIDKTRILYTGDYSMEEDRHLSPGSIPPGGHPDVLIVESTFGTTSLPRRAERERNFTTVVDNVVSRGGACLIPVFALGRAQELLLILDEYWKGHPELQTIPIYYASKLASKALRVYQTFINTMSKHIQTLMDISNPFKLQCIQSMTNTDDFVVQGPCVVMAAPGFLQSGVSRQLFDRWCEDEKNCVIIAGYTVEGTLAHDLLLRPKEITGLDNRIRTRNCDIEHITFSAHVDYSQNSSFIKSVTPDNIILVHGEKGGMKKLKDDLDKEIRRNWPTSHRPPVVMPENGVRVKLRFNKPLEADIVGSAAAAMQETLVTSTQGQLPDSALLVTESYQSRVVLREELPMYTSCRPGSIKQRMVVPVPSTVSELFQVYKVNDEKDFEKSLLRLIGENIEEIFDVVATYDQEIIIQNDVSVSLMTGNAVNSTTTANANYYSVQGVLLQWYASPVNDMIADSAISVISQTLSVPNLLKLNLSIHSSPVSGSPSTMKSEAPLSSQQVDERGRLIGSRRRKASSRSNSRELANPSSKANYNENSNDNDNKEQQERHKAIVKRMKESQLDPQLALPLEVQNLLLAQEGGSSDQNSQIASTLARIGDANSIVSQRMKLERVRDLLLQRKQFPTIKLNSEGNKLIFQRIDPHSNAVVEEAFVFILFRSLESNGSDGMVVEQEAAEAEVEVGLHNAVVQCANEEFRKQICAALQSLE